LEQYLKNKRQEATNMTSSNAHKSREINRQFLKRQLEAEEDRRQSISPTRSPTKYQVYQPELQETIEGDQAAPTIDHQTSV